MGRAIYIVLTVSLMILQDEAWHEVYYTGMYTSLNTSNVSGKRGKTVTQSSVLPGHIPMRGESEP